MTYQSYSEGIDEIHRLFAEKWFEGSAKIVQYVPEIRWWNREVASKPDPSKHWCRFSSQTVSNEQSTFRGPERKTCGKRFTTIGLVFVQLFFSKTRLNKDDDRKLAEVAQDVFQGNSERGKVWFRDPKIVELPEESDWFRINVIAEYNFDYVVF